MATPRRDVSTAMPVEEDAHEVDMIESLHTDIVVAKAPIDTIIECMDTIHRASIDIPSSDELAQVLLCVQQLKDAIYTYTQAQAQRVVDDVDVSVNE